MVMSPLHLPEIEGIEFDAARVVGLLPLAVTRGRRTDVGGGCRGGSVADVGEGTAIRVN